MHDAVLTASEIIGIKIDKNKLFKLKPPRRTVNTSFSEVMEVPFVKLLIKSETINVSRSTGGKEYCLFQLRNEGVMVVVGEVLGFKNKWTTHEFVLNTRFNHPNVPTSWGYIVDNRKTHNTRYYC